MVSKRTIQHIEGDPSHRAQLGTALALADALGVDVRALFPAQFVSLDTHAAVHRAPAVVTVCHRTLADVGAALRGCLEGSPPERAELERLRLDVESLAENAREAAWSS